MYDRIKVGNMLVSLDRGSRWPYRHHGIHDADKMTSKSVLHLEVTASYFVSKASSRLKRVCNADALLTIVY